MVLGISPRRLYAVVSRLPSCVSGVAARNRPIGSDDRHLRTPAASAAVDLQQTRSLQGTDTAASLVLRQPHRPAERRIHPDGSVFAAL